MITSDGLMSKDKLRVGFILHLTADWLGGVNYYRNLLNLIYDNPDMNIEPVVFYTTKMDVSLLNGFPPVEYVKLNGWDRFCSKRLREIFHKEKYWELLAKKYRIDIFSHSAVLVDAIKVISWLPDFQHKYLSELFDERELASREEYFNRLAKNADGVILSSNDAKKDFERFYPDFASKAAVYQFFVPIEKFEYNVQDLRNRYKVPQKFFFIPNQFWKHKNHRMVLEALKILSDKGNKDIKVYCSGNTRDIRNVNYFRDLMQYCDDNGLDNRFFVLGSIPYRDVQALQRECHALINPSLFEGWSTMVEEAKSLGKLIILSDIAVHKEQNPAGGIFFEHMSAQDLASKMELVWKLDNKIKQDLQENAGLELKKRERDAIITYRRILDDTLAR